MVAGRLEAAADALGLTGAARHVLTAVIELLPRRWKRVRDDRVQLAQLVELCPVPHHQRTVGRELARLAERELITYTPAQGRGRTATIAIHERLLEGVDELARDDSGGVVVPFSRRSPLISKETYPPTPRTPSEQPHRTRPSEVKVNPNDVRRVLAEMPAVFADLPKRLRWLLGRAIRDKLARGWRSDDVLGVLAAELPADVSHPYRLAKWRFSKNLIGSGPRLAPHQRAYDTWAAEQQRRQDNERHQSAYQRVCAATTPAQRDSMLRTLIERLDLDPTSLDRDRAVSQAARIAQREHPSAPLSAAIAAWLQTAHSPAVCRSAGQPAATTPHEPARTSRHGENLGGAVHWLASAADSGGCVSCGRPGQQRPELPLLSVVCDDCWTAHHLVEDAS